MNLLVRKDLQQVSLGRHRYPLEENEGLQMTDHIVHSKGNNKFRITLPSLLLALHQGSLKRLVRTVYAPC